MSKYRQLKNPDTPPQVLERRELYSIANIETLVHTFYQRVRNDLILGPIFNQRIEDWDRHLPRMVLFWRAVLRSEPSFTPAKKGSPLHLHQQIEGLTLDHYRHWLALFGQVSDEVFNSQAANGAKKAALQIARSLSRNISVGDEEKSL